MTRYKCSCGHPFIADVWPARCICGMKYNAAGQVAEVVAAQPASGGLGDLAEKCLQKIGITENRYNDVKAMFGLLPNCNCKKRKQWLNAVSAWFNNGKPQ